MFWRLDHVATKFLPLLITTVFPSLLIAAPAEFAVFFDEDLPIYREVINGIEGELDGSFLQFSVKEIAGPIKLHPAATMIAIGPKAAVVARRLGGAHPLVYCLVPRSENYALDGSHIVGVGLEPDPTTYLQAFKAFIPNVARVGVLYNVHHSKKQALRLSLIAKRFGIVIVPIEITEAKDVSEALLEKAHGLQAFWMISDPISLHMDAVQALLRFADENRVPVLGINESTVVNGALFGFFLDYGQVGRQAARLAKQLANGIAPKMVSPAGLGIAVNLKTAEKNALLQVLSLELLRFAQRHQLPIRVYG